MTYHIRLDQFEGPLDLLLSLIEKEKLDITQVSLAQVADQYVQSLRHEPVISLESLSSFLAIAARLILIKSRALLPVLKFSEDEEEAMEDLEQRLKEYRRFREAAVRLGKVFEEGQRAYGRESFLGHFPIFYLPQKLSAAQLRSHFLEVLGSMPTQEILPEEELRAVISLEEKIIELQQSLSSRLETSFANLTQGATGRAEVIVSFLAVLEMVKQRIIRTEQAGFWQDIFIKRA